MTYNEAYVLTTHLKKYAVKTESFLCAMELREIERKFFLESDDSEYYSVSWTFSDSKRLIFCEKTFYERLNKAIEMDVSISRDYRIKKITEE